MKRIVAVAALAAMLVPGAATAEPSDTCSTGVVPPGSSPAGAGIRLWTEPRAAALTICNDGSVAPLPGSIRVTADANTPSAVVAYDGDPESSLLPCTDGYLAAGADDKGAATYQSSDGGFTSRARKKAPDEFVRDTFQGCVAPLPS